MADYYPPSFTDFAKQLSDSPKDAGQHLDRAIQLIYQQFYNQRQKLDSGSQAVVGSATITTALSKVDRVIAGISNGAVATNLWVTAIPSPVVGSIIVRVWKPTAAGDTTPIAATASVTVNWIATSA